MWEELQDLDKKIDNLRSRVRKAVEPSPASAREFVTLIAQEITCVEDDLTEQLATFYNGSSDSYILHRLSVAVSTQFEPQSTTFRRSLDRYAFGYMRRGFGAQIGPFDFVWNYLISSRQSYYSRQALGSSVFNGLERSQAFDLYEPLILKPADSIEFRMKPTAYALPGTPDKEQGRVYFVNFLAVGYRRPL